MIVRQSHAGIFLLAKLVAGKELKLVVMYTVVLVSTGKHSDAIRHEIIKPWD